MLKSAEDQAIKLVGLNINDLFIQGFYHILMPVEAFYHGAVLKINFCYDKRSLMHDFGLGQVTTWISWLQILNPLGNVKF